MPPDPSAPAATSPRVVVPVAGPEPPSDPRAGRPARVVITSDGPVLLEGPVELELPDGRRVLSERPVTALCVCGNSRRYPVCDTSHRRRVRGTTEEDR